MITIITRVEGKMGGVPCVLSTDETDTIFFNALTTEGNEEIAGRIERDNDLNEVRVVVDGECVWSTILA